MTETITVKNFPEGLDTSGLSIKTGNKAEEALTKE